ncbi:hypothetical protein GF319_12170 [Candidatus Bathyarchaeota archaeon]|jgi:Fe-S-cluster containining protein|nr:hypothetical protein [Candidatus Bathyarchaeota archaeon]
MNEVPIYNLGNFEYKGETIEFYYPADFVWSCEECGACCRDSTDRKRRILLTEKDINFIEQEEKDSFYEEIDEFPFKGEMKTEKGECIFLKGTKCEIYNRRALLCRTYPFWIERHEQIFMIRADPSCPGIGEGTEIGEVFFQNLLKFVLDYMDY